MGALQPCVDHSRATNVAASAMMLTTMYVHVGNPGVCPARVSCDCHVLTPACTLLPCRMRSKQISTMARGLCTRHSHGNALRSLVTGSAKRPTCVVWLGVATSHAQCSARTTVPLTHAMRPPVPTAQQRGAPAEPPHRYREQELAAGAAPCAGECPRPSRARGVVRVAMPTRDKPSATALALTPASSV